MANSEHISMLRQGAQAWNNWRVLQQLLIPDLREADLRSARLAQVNLSAANLRGADLREANLRGADLVGSDLREANLVRADLSGANLAEARFQGADLFRVNLAGANLTEVDLFEVHLHAADLSGARLRDVNLGGADLHDADLNGADLIGANLRGAGLSGADFRGALLVRADLTKADLRGIDLSQSTIGWTVLGDVDLSAARGLDTVIHHGPSTIGIDAVYRSGCDIPEAFLRGAGVPEGLITYVCSLAGQSPRFLAHFVSYADADREFAERLHADLRARGVPSWLIPEASKIGEHMHAHIDESVRLYDRLLLVVSKDSVGSQWIEQEVRSALAKEHSTGHQVLFPIEVDGALAGMDGGWASDMTDSHDLADFRQWRQPDDYGRALSQLLKDLGMIGEPG